MGVHDGSLGIGENGGVRGFCGEPFQALAVATGSLANGLVYGCFFQFGRHFGTRGCLFVGICKGCTVRVAGSAWKISMSASIQ